MSDEVKYVGQVHGIKRATVMRDTQHQGTMLLVIETDEGSSHLYTVTEEIAAALSVQITKGSEPAAQ